MSLNQQISNFEAVTLPDLRATAANIRGMKGHDFLHDCFLPKSLFVIGTGGNDYLLNYYQPRNTARPQLSDFTRSLITELSAHLQVSGMLVNAHSCALLTTYRAFPSPFIANCIEGAYCLQKYGS